MKNGKRLLILFQDLAAAITSFEKSLKIDLSKYGELETDVLKSGQVKKFEYTIELLWTAQKLRSSPPPKAFP